MCVEIFALPGFRKLPLYRHPVSSLLRRSYSVVVSTSTMLCITLTVFGYRTLCNL